MPQQPSDSRQHLWSPITSDGGTLAPNALPAVDPVAVLKAHGLDVPPNLPAHVLDELVRVVTLVWVNGRIVPREHFYIDPSDEGLLFGRGIWESTRTVDHVPWLWPLHTERLLRTAADLGIGVDPARIPDAAEVTRYARALAGCDLVVRLNVTAGVPAAKRPGVVWMTAQLIPSPVAAVRLRTCPTVAPRDEPYRVWKTFQYGGRLAANQKAHDAGFDGALMVDAGDNLLEMAHANLFVRLADGWATPPANGDLLPGTVRQHLLAHAPVPIREQVVPRAALAGATEAFVTNSKIGIVPVTQIDGQTFAVGRETRELAEWLMPSPRVQG
ncbi:aminotransferase iv : Branched-chain amino acid aminotransferase/4-amino-4-deoxychorismate lyase OS=Singulisphaera acidiphila (strain ATCC BAA-1392 / DSM 18658 / VKM B-2454 / MOB10) GN=Sinac_6322 PE=3 SV=1: Aminotran_4 [Gemmataceae bacterium]|jgi:branched-subunit amino acid aminotransferase/4-amino-4-deoxychorismate lyase|nr:aminotransferase iv : Branched-chain amino acid aminotransferase/4-amino-4-deoxychorismate lyase OS=Singulisphaera acidiphila (strain ATCC BAA-1392 / DSM 18658 / VKM B-2454 / MOB10) GN=Sinac_6322 PE=3 SV=1: Aminotran_4 [Gemmataceae bacterium]VTU00005.1 aminotransferase iv : Branched-chain amino acid aminotransferase/4-amino-4-deoxychorismate lyase OS=Singulisphaera acidiphila (strain ATCC BAA-1392 / DSM 18658 / VKM B-2454 / MOB10) GN=Sinac_6322 PE=3 SV=1: Aminotran_4 [Gemmataceae bacterium]